MAEAIGSFTKEENVLIEAGDCSLAILPKLGGKIASIRIKGRELLQARLPRTDRAPKPCPLTGDASGWTSACPRWPHAQLKPLPERLTSRPRRPVRVAWKPIATSAHSATFRGECFSLPLVVERTAALNETAGVCICAWTIR